jgi:hypothetical protein
MEKYKSKLLSAFLIFPFVGFWGCNKDVEIPSYIRIEKVEYRESGPNGNGGSNIPDAWVYVNSELMGVFELPAIIPIVTGEPVDLLVGAGIKLNGISTTRDEYPYYNRWEKDGVTLFEDSIVTITPFVANRSTIIAPWNEDFEDAAISIDSTAGSDVSLTRKSTTQEDPDYIENFSGYAQLSEDKPGLKLRTKNVYDLPTNGTPVFLEMDYKTNQEFVVSIIIDLIDQAAYEEPILFIRPSMDDSGNPEWNKIYIDLTDILDPVTSSNEFEFTITALYDDSNPTGELYFDNLKLIYD